MSTTPPLQQLLELLELAERTDRPITVRIDRQTGELHAQVLDDLRVPTPRASGAERRARGGRRGSSRR